jgi:hypothetical protein
MSVCRAGGPCRLVGVHAEHRRRPAPAALEGQGRVTEVSAQRPRCPRSAASTWTSPERIVTTGHCGTGTVARARGAGCGINTKPKLRYGYYTYFSNLPVDGFGELHPAQPRVWLRPDQRRAHHDRGRLDRTPRRGRTRPMSRLISGRRCGSGRASRSGWSTRGGRCRSLVEPCRVISASRSVRGGR